MTAVLAPAGEHPDVDLVRAARHGDPAAGAELFRRHHVVVRAVALNLTRCAIAADDLVGHAWSGLLAQFRAGRGPDRAVRSYLCAAVRNAAYTRGRRDRRTVSLDDPDAPVPEPAVPFHDRVTADADRSMAATAFACLPPRWQAVLWETEVVGQSPAAIAPRFGLTPNAVSALAHRARRALRVAYLQQHIKPPDTEPCRTIAAQLAAWTRETLSHRAATDVTEHLTLCARCPALAAELAAIDPTLGPRSPRRPADTRPGGQTLASNPPPGRARSSSHERTRRTP